MTGKEGRQELTRYFAIDPGLSGTGWAIVDRYGRRRPTLMKSGSIGIKTSDVRRINDEAESPLYVDYRALKHLQKHDERNDAARVLHYTLQLEELFKEECCPDTIVAIEKPEYQTSRAGFVASRRGDIVKLSLLIGSIMQAAHKNSLPVVLVPVSHWKGQLTKKATFARLQARYRMKRFNAAHHPEQKLAEFPTTHECDAAALALFMVGAFDAKKKV